MLIAGGGTGGHLFPGMAVAEEFLGRSPDHRVAFIGTELGIEARKVPEAGYDFHAIRSRGIAGLGAFGKLRGLGLLPLSLFEAMAVVREIGPSMALGVGGFVSGPAVLAAWILRVPCAIQEQNAVPGWTNRILGRIVARVFISFEPARASFASADKKGKVVLAGNPARRSILQAIEAAGQNGKDGDGKADLLIVGGSQGAHALNVMVPAALALLPGEKRDGLRVLHQSGERDREEVEKAYIKTGVEARVLSFIDDMAGAYAKADLLISRAGAGAVAEIALAGKPSILVPFPHAASDHQAGNAATLVGQGAAVMLREEDADAEVMAKTIDSLVFDKQRLAEMSERTALAARPRAAAEIVDHCMALIGRGQEDIG